MMHLKTRLPTYLTRLIPVTLKASTKTEKKKTNNSTEKQVRKVNQQFTETEIQSCSNTSLFKKS